jgi:hypothetical protein
MSPIGPSRPLSLRAGNGSSCPRLCKNDWSRGVEQLWVSAGPIARHVQPLWELDGSRLRAVGTSNGGTALDSRRRGYVLIAAISGPGPMMLMTRVRL